MFIFLSFLQTSKIAKGNVELLGEQTRIDKRKRETLVFDKQNSSHNSNNNKKNIKANYTDMEIKRDKQKKKKRKEKKNQTELQSAPVSFLMYACLFSSNGRQIKIGQNYTKHRAMLRFCTCGYRRICSSILCCFSS